MDCSNGNCIDVNGLVLREAAQKSPVTCAKPATGAGLQNSFGCNATVMEQMKKYESERCHINGTI